MEHADLLKRIQTDGVEFVHLQFTDLHGALKALTLPVVALASALERGAWFDGSSIEGFAPIESSDMVLRPDPKTYRLIPWSAGEGRQARMICDIFRPDGEPFAGDPRQVLRRVLAKAASMGFGFNAGPELEFFLFQPREHCATARPVPFDQASYFDFEPADLATVVRADIMKTMERYGIEAEAAHHEVAIAQHEIDFRYADALTAADNVMTVRQIVRTVATHHGLRATFMPKPVQGINGSGMHVHQNLTDREGRNAFFDAQGAHRLSPAALGFIAGQLAHARALTAVVAPLVNSYKRLTPGYEAPVYVSWARTNRSVLIRVPSASPGREQTTRAELRCPDPAANPYLALAVMLAAGLDGIERTLRPPDPVEENVYHLGAQRLAELGITPLPGSLGEALEELAKDAVIRDALGPALYDPFVRVKTAEWDAYRINVSEWELDRYLETY
jgi:glutamine synthetase